MADWWVGILVDEVGVGVFSFLFSSVVDWLAAIQISNGIRNLGFVKADRIIYPIANLFTAALTEVPTKCTSPIDSD